MDSNHTIGFIIESLQDLELQPQHSSCQLFVGGDRSKLIGVVLSSSEICIESLGSIPEELVEAKPLPPTLNLQLDNVVRDNKNR